MKVPRKKFDGHMHAEVRLDLESRCYAIRTLQQSG